MGDNIAKSILEQIFESIKKGLVVEKPKTLPKGNKTTNTSKSEKIIKKRRWTENENIIILEYLADTIKKGYSIEKPNAIAFYQKFLDKNPKIKVKPLIIKNKVRNFKTNYIKALKWEEETGQGIKECDGEVSFRAVFEKKFPYQSLCEEIFGKRLNVVPPKKSESRQIGRPEKECSIVDTTEERNSEVPEISDVQEGRRTPGPDIEHADVGTIMSDVDVDRMDDNNEANFGVDEEATLEHVDETILSCDNEAILGDAIIMADDEDDDDAPPEPVRTTKAITSAISIASKRIVDKVTKVSQIKTAKGAYESITQARGEAFERKLYIETEKLDFEKFKFYEQQKHIEKKMEREFELKEKEIDLKRLQEENQKQVRLLELEVEKLKWTALLAKHGINELI